jgi:hypothetical protein
VLGTDDPGTPTTEGVHRKANATRVRRHRKKKKKVCC